ncbi:MAG: transposase [Flavobacteriales bacterium]
MKTKFRKVFLRLSHWDYREEGAYFITICKKNRVHFFGEIKQGKMTLSSVGEMAKSCWLEIESHFPNVHLREFIFMPDHMHGVIVIDEFKSTGADSAIIRENRFQNIGKNSISSIVGSFKSAVSRKSREINPAFSWQPRFHDRVIRSSIELDRIENYIKRNVENYHKKR